jgi:hypothetical protein
VTKDASQRFRGDFTFRAYHRTYGSAVNEWVKCQLWWRIDPRMKPRLQGKVMIDDKEWKMSIRPNSQLSYPQVQLYEKALRREAIIMAEQSGGPKFVDEEGDEEEQSEGSGIKLDDPEPENKPAIVEGKAKED